MFGECLSLLNIVLGKDIFKILETMNAIVVHAFSLVLILASSFPLNGRFTFFFLPPFQTSSFCGGKNVAWDVVSRVKIPRFQGEGRNKLKERLLPVFPRRRYLLSNPVVSFPNVDVKGGCVLRKPLYLSGVPYALSSFLYISSSRD